MANSTKTEKSNYSNFTGLNIVTVQDAVTLYMAEFEKKMGSHKSWNKKSTSDKPEDTYRMKWSRVKIVHENPDFFEEVISGGKPMSVLEHTGIVDNSDGSDTLTQKFSARRTRSSCDVHFNKGIIIPMDSILPLPDVVVESDVGKDGKSVSAGKELVIQNNSLETYMEDELSWQIESTVKVAKGDSIKVTTTVLEKKWEGTFKVTTKISGKVVISVYENREFKRTQEADIAVIFNCAKDKDTSDKYSNIRIEGSVVEFDTDGYMRLKLNVGHQTKVEKMN